MKPPEILGMLEEAAGTRMYENKKDAALRTLEKKQVKVDEIDKVCTSAHGLSFSFPGAPSSSSRTASTMLKPNTSPVFTSPLLVAPYKGRSLGGMSVVEDVQNFL